MLGFRVPKGPGGPHFTIWGGFCVSPQEFVENLERAVHVWLTSFLVLRFLTKNQGVKG